MLKIRDAKPLLALTALFAPWDIFVYGRGLGWGMHFVFGEFAETKYGVRYFTPYEFLGLFSKYDPSSRLAIQIWLLTVLVAFFAALYVILARFINGTTTRKEDRAIGAAFIGSSIIFVLSRALLHKYFLFSSSTANYWYTVPIGAIYVLFVGLVFYKDLFRLGAN